MVMILHTGWGAGDKEGACDASCKGDQQRNLSAGRLVRKMRDDWRRYQRHKAVDSKQHGGKTLGSRWVEVQADYDHVAQDRNDKSIEEGL
jgi:hypothetical protein